MSQTETITTSTSNGHLSQQICLNPPPNDDQILHYESAQVVDMALERLQRAGMMLIEWRSLLYCRMNVPMIVKNYSYVVPDEQLTNASDILSIMGLPLSTPSACFLVTAGDFQSKGYFHRVTRWTMSSSVQYMVLYPLSFSSLSLSELEKEPPMHLYSSIRCPSIYVPSRPAVYASIIRLMAKYPLACGTRTVLQSDLAGLIGYDLLQLEDGCIDSDDDETQEVSDRLVQASLIVEAWGTGGVWRKGEEWIGDALNAVVVCVGRIEHFPCK
ncbi:hypothetical protein BU17DRAFT_36186 [Hysterangium stoloniferum]|nr:hypothetical protein BU17DRAFT_36186 [Hysterangium stoloniferum]